MNGTFSLLLHAHIPYCRKSGVWPAGEEWLFEAINESYVPLLRVLRGWKLDGVRARITIGVVPALAEQLADGYMRRRFGEYMEDNIRRAEADVRRFAADHDRRTIAEYWRDRLTANYDAYRTEFHGDLLGTLRWLQDEGVCEVITSAATHGFLPLLEHDSAVRSQIRVGVGTYRRYFGKDPRGFWLPECAYRPSVSRPDGRRRRGIDEWLADEGVQYLVVEGVGLTSGRLKSEMNGDPRVTPTTYSGYRLPSGVAVYGRNDATSKQVWSSESGYPGDPSYLEFHRKDPESGLRYWRVTGRHGDKQLYDPARAMERVASHADHFVSLLRRETVAGAECARTDEPCIVAPFDAELFGHWWHEGVDWIDAMGRRLALEGDVVARTLGEHTSPRRDSYSTVNLGPSTWGVNADFTVWNSPEHAWIWPLINSSVLQMEDLLAEVEARGQSVWERENRLLRQLARELLLMEGSDWPFLMYTEQARAYANHRFHTHHQRFHRLLWAAKNVDDVRRMSDADLRSIEDTDNPWAEIDFSLFRRQ